MDAKGRYACLVLMLMTASPVAAQSVGDLASVQAETLMARAKAARAEAVAKLNATAGAGAIAGSEALPVVRGVYGTGDRLYATFLFADGSTVDATAGDTLPGGYSVRALSATRVQLARDGRRFTVGFSDVRPLAPAAAEPNVPEGFGAPAPLAPAPFGG